MRTDLRGRVVVVTGGAGGIGQSLARAFREAGAVVVLMDRDASALGDAARATGAQLTLTCDVTDPAACDAAMSEVIGRLGGIDVLVNNAGISHRGRFVDTEVEVLRQVMEVNYFGSVHCTRAALPSIIERGGWVVATSSVAGFAPLVGRTGYAASKHALHGFFDSLRAELADTEETVLIACPAYTATAIRQNALDGSGAPYGDRAPTLRRELQPDEVARQVVHAVRRRWSAVRIGSVSRASWWVSRVAPAAYEALMRRTQHPTR